VRLDLDPACFQADERMGDRPCEHFPPTYGRNWDV
jgi:hypothetical protein